MFTFTRTRQVALFESPLVARPGNSKIVNLPSLLNTDQRRGFAVKKKKIHKKEMYAH